jgi:TRAP-type mannitol/chloroaromatic compound transport system substrate-binding protein
MKKYSIFLYLLLIVFSSACSDNTEKDQTKTTDHSEKFFKWKMVTTWPANFPIFQNDQLSSFDPFQCYHYKLN